MNKIWSESEKQYIRTNADTMTDNQLAVKLSELTSRKITIQAVRKQRQKLKIVKMPGRGICSVRN